MVIANEAYGRKNIKDELKEEMNIKLGLETKMGTIKQEMDRGFKATQIIIVEGAESTRASHN